MNALPLTGTGQLLRLLDPYIPDDFINDHWNRRPARGPRWRFSAAQLWRVHLLALLTPVHSINLLVVLLSEQPAWRAFARLRHRHEVPDVRILNAFRDRLGVMGFRQINETLLASFIQTAMLWEGATALIDATDLPAACSGFKKKKPAATRPGAPRSAVAPLKPAKVAGLSATKNTLSDCGGDPISTPSCCSHWSVGSLRPMSPKAVCSSPAFAIVNNAGSGGRARWWPTWGIWPPSTKNSAASAGVWPW